MKYFLQVIATVVLFTSCQTTKWDVIKQSNIIPFIIINFNKEIIDLSPNKMNLEATDVNIVEMDKESVGVFNGKTSKIAINLDSPIPLSKFTMIFKIKSNFSKSWQAIINSNGWGNIGDCHFQFSGEKMELVICGNGPYYGHPEYSFLKDNWYNIVLTYNKEEKIMKTYVNSKLIQTRLFDIANDYIFSKVQLGAWDGEDRFFDGVFDFFCIYEGCMEELNIEEYYNKSI